MIEYRRELFGLRSLWRFHGSAVAKAQVPAIFSTIILIIAIYGFNVDIQENDTIRIIQHPYVIQALVVFVTFMITFRANFAYARVRYDMYDLCVFKLCLRVSCSPVLLFWNSNCLFLTFLLPSFFCTSQVLGGSNRIASHVFQVVRFMCQPCRLSLSVRSFSKGRTAVFW
jgi:hypothetical protein